MGLFLAVHSGITPEGLRETLWGAGETQFRQMKDKVHTHYTISLALYYGVFFL